MMVAESRKNEPRVSWEDKEAAEGQADSTWLNAASSLLDLLMNGGLRISELARKHTSMLRDRSGPVFWSRQTLRAEEFGPSVTRRYTRRSAPGKSLSRILMTSQRFDPR